MGHHTKENMLNVRAALDALTIEEHGVDGTKIFLYGEGWDFGEVANNALFVNATQVNMAGTDIGTFNDRQRDALRGGGYASGYRQQGYINADDHSADILLEYADLVRLGMAGTQQEYVLESKDGVATPGRDYVYSDSPMAAYGLGPLDVINYASAHDNETLFDIIQIKAGDDADLDERIRMQNLATGIVALSQGIPFFHAGVEILRSKGMDRNSFNSGDWFNVLDLSYQHNNWGRGLPPAEENSPNYELMSALLDNPELLPSGEQIQGALAQFEEAIRIRRSSPLFRLGSTEDIQQRVSFHNTGPDQVPGMIVMRLLDEVDGLEPIDENHSQIVVVVNASSADQQFTDAEAPWAVSGADLQLHPCQVDSSDEVVRSARVENGGFAVPARTLAVFVELTETGAATCP